MIFQLTALNVHQLQIYNLNLPHQECKQSHTDDRKWFTKQHCYSTIWEAPVMLGRSWKMGMNDGWSLLKLLMTIRRWNRMLLLFVTMELVVKYLEYAKSSAQLARPELHQPDWQSGGWRKGCTCNLYVESCGYPWSPTESHRVLRSPTRSHRIPTESYLGVMQSSAESPSHVEFCWVFHSIASVSPRSPLVPLIILWSQ